MLISGAKESGRWILSQTKGGKGISSCGKYQFFVNEKIAPEAEKLLRKKSDSAVAVYRAYDGRIVLTDIEIDGKPILSAVKE